MKSALSAACLCTFTSRATLPTLLCHHSSIPQLGIYPTAFLLDCYSPTRTTTSCIASVQDNLNHPPTQGCLSTLLHLTRLAAATHNPTPLTTSNLVQILYRFCGSSTLFINMISKYQPCGDGYLPYPSTIPEGLGLLLDADSTNQMYNYGHLHDLRGDHMFTMSSYAPITADICPTDPWTTPAPTALATPDLYYSPTALSTVREDTPMSGSSSEEANTIIHHSPTMIQHWQAPDAPFSPDMMDTKPSVEDFVDWNFIDTDPVFSPAISPPASPEASPDMSPLASLALSPIHSPPCPAPVNESPEKIMEHRTRLVRKRGEKVKPGEGRPRCDCCGISFSRKHNLQQHLLRRKNRGNEPYDCSECDLKFSRPADRKRHFDSVSYPQTFDMSISNNLQVHSREKKYRCECCENRFARLDTLRR